MRNAGYGTRKILLILTIAGATYPVGALLSTFIPKELYIAIIAFVAGDFIYIGVEDLLGEAHRRLNYKVVLTTILGAALFIIIEAII
jgi:zinc and cadmium transporter